MPINETWHNAIHMPRNPTTEQPRVARGACGALWMPPHPVQAAGRDAEAQVGRVVAEAVRALFNGPSNHPKGSCASEGAAQPPAGGRTIADDRILAGLASLGNPRGRCSIFVNVGRFRFRPMGRAEQQTMMRRMEQDVPPIARESPGFRGVYFARLSDSELMTVWLWDSEADWEAALAPFGPLLQEYVVPNLAQPLERADGEVVVQFTL